MKTSTRSLVSAVLGAWLLSLVGCGDDDGGGGSASPSPTNPSQPTATFTPTEQPTTAPTPTATRQPTATNTPTPSPTPTTSDELDISICAPDAGPFSAEISNPFFPLPVGAQWILEGEDDEGTEVRVEITSLDETEVVAGVTTRVIEERETEDGELVEVSRNFFVQTSDGTVCYYGEDVDDYEDGKIVGHEGAWRAGVDGALPGILIPGDPQVGQSFRQEVAIGVAEDRAVQVAAGETVEVELGTFTDTIRYEESSPLDSGTSDKVYARGVGLIVDDDVERVEGGSDLPELEDVKLLIEHNSTDEDTGYQGFADSDPWNELTITGPGGVSIATVAAEGGLLDFGFTELFFETSEPENAEVPIDDVLARLPEGTYTYSADLVDAETDKLTATLTHDIPAGPELISPADGATGLDPAAIVVSWEPVSEDIDGDPIEIVGYQVIVEEDAEALYPQGFARPVFSVYLPAGATSVSVPAEFMRDNTCYEYEVLAIEESGNQTLSSAEFETGEGCERPEDPDDTPRLTQAKILIEHNSAGEDTGFQGFGDGDPWNELTISGPGDVTVVRVTPAGGLFNFGLTELFFETSEPENAEVPIDEVLERLPEGTYTFRGQMVDGGESTLTATFTHDIPAGPQLTSPADGDEDVDPGNTVVAWEPVTTDIDGDPITIVGYQVIVEEDAEPLFPAGFAEAQFSIYLPATATSVTVPAEFMRGGTDYEAEVLAIEESGNQTISETEFTTSD